MQGDETAEPGGELAALAVELRDLGGNHVQLYRLAELTVKHLGACEPARHHGAAELARAERALLSCRDIGVAIGVLMTKRGIDRDAAFTLLRQSSQHSQVKLRDLAADYLRTGELPVTRRAAG